MRTGRPLVLCLLLFGAVFVPSSYANNLISHGIPARVAESRGTFATTDVDGTPIVLAVIQDQYDARPRNALLVIDAQTGRTEQFFYEENGRYAGDSFASMLVEETGKFYTMFGDVFLEFDISKREWSYAARIGGLAMAFAPGRNGEVFFATYPATTLWEFEPGSQRLTNHGRLDPQEMYPFSLAVDSEGWVYAGIGTAASNIVAFNPATGEHRSLAEPNQRRVGQGEVYLSTSGEVYGRSAPGEPWYRLRGGERQPVPAPGERAVTGAIRWSQILGTWPNGDELLVFDIHERYFAVARGMRNPRVVRFDYETSGANITSLVTGPDGKIYGSTSHPMRFFSYDPHADQLKDFGGIKAVGGGNLTSLDVQGKYIVASAYAGGHMYKYDPGADWNPESYTRANPKLLAQIGGPIARPRKMLAYPDGRHIVMAGFADYGWVGGGIAVYDLEKDEYTLFTADQLLPGHSTITMRVLPDGNLVGGTSVEAPGGGHPTESIAKLFIMDWETKEILFQTEPDPGLTAFGRRIGGSREVVSIEVGPDGLVYGVTNEAVFFVFDPERLEVVHRESISEYGRPLRDTTMFRHGDYVYALLQRRLVQIEPGTFKHRAVSEIDPPATGGVAVLGDRIFFPRGSELWSMRLPDR